jgi:sortase (surface protein transpeptidase)
MPISPTAGGRRGVFAAVVTVVLLLLGGGLLARALTAPGPPPQPDGSQGRVSQPPRSGTATPSPRIAPTSSATQAPATDFGPIMKPSAPVVLRIPSIRLVTKDLVDLRLDAKGVLEAPKDFQRAGWYAAGPTPGEFGPAVIAAHVDSHLGPAVFYRLGALKKGAKVLVERQDGSTAAFVVDRVERYPKAQFPTSQVYADTGGRAELRLITCGGDIDQRSGHYLDNVVAYAHLVA